MDTKLKHLEFIQNTVNRLATSSFRMKGWAVVLVSALLVLLTRDGRIEFAFIGLIPTFVLWGLDGYFLRRERQFRDLYNHVRSLPDQDIDFSMDISLFKRSWLGATFSVTLVLFYMAMVVSIGLVVLIVITQLECANETQGIL